VGLLGRAGTQNSMGLLASSGKVETRPRFPTRLPLVHAAETCQNERFARKDVSRENHRCLS